MKTLSHSIALSFLAMAAWLSASIAPGDPEWPNAYPEWWYNADDPANGGDWHGAKQAAQIGTL